MMAKKERFSVLFSALLIGIPPSRSLALYCRFPPMRMNYMMSSLSSKCCHRCRHLERAFDELDLLFPVFSSSNLSNAQSFHLIFSRDNIEFSEPRLEFLKRRPSSAVRSVLLLRVTSLTTPPHLGARESEDEKWQHIDGIFFLVEILIAAVLALLQYPLTTGIVLPSLSHFFVLASL